jgi:Phosphotransferase enzyme family
MLREPVRRALGRESAEVVSWECRSIHNAFNQVTGGLFRIDGQAMDCGESLPWSIVLKIARNAIHLGRSTADPSEPNYWKREPLLYQSGLLDHLPAGIVAPQCYGVDEPDTSSAWIWLEHVSDISEARWSTWRYAGVARQLGVFNGAYFTAGSHPTAPFLSHSQRWADASAWSTLFPQIAVARELPIVRQTWAASLHRRIQEISNDSHAFYAALDRLPMTFCHLDAFRRNILIRKRTEGSEEIVAVDWAFTGLGPVGADLAPLVGVDIVIGGIRPDQLSELDAAAFRDYVGELDTSAFEAYVNGLRDAGWDDDPRLVRLGYTASVVLRYALYPIWARAVDDQGRTVDQVGGQPIQTFLERGALIATLLCDLADEARDLLESLRD